LIALVRPHPILLSVALTLLAMRAEADGGFRYRPEWRKFSAADYVGLGVMGAGLVTLELGWSDQTDPEWTGAVPYIDRPTRDALVASSREGRANAEKYSNWLWYSSVAYPVLDVVVTPLARGGNHVPVWQMTMINAQAFATIALLVRMPQKWIGRERPVAIGCEQDPDYMGQCQEPIRFVSFPGGHFAVSMTGAGLTCAHHLHGELYGGGAPDALACGGALATAAAVGYLRMRSDDHWLSDQLVGGTLGIFSGYALPVLLYYRPFWWDAPQPAPRDDAPSGNLGWTLLPDVSQQSLGLSLLVFERH
jgi:membrane-associated phospholipid phosphatase